MNEGGHWVRGEERELLAKELLERYAKGESIRQIVSATGRKYGLVRTILRENGVELRSRGGPRSGPRRPRPTPSHVADMWPGFAHRRVDDWTRKGYLKATIGKGGSRTWSPQEQAIAKLMVRLVDEVGLPVPVAARVARGTCPTVPTYQLAPGISITIDADGGER